MSEQKVVEDQWIGSQKKVRDRGRSLLGPVVLIAAGVLFLLANLNMLPQPDWGYAFSYWPLLLIFIGLNIIVVQVPAPGGTFLSLLVSLLTVGVFGYLLFAGPDNLKLRSLGVPAATTEAQEVPFTVPMGSLESAEIEMDLGRFSTEVSGLAGGPNLVEGAIWTAGDLILDVSGDETRTTVKIGEEADFVFLLNPASWITEKGDRTWRIAINEDIPLDLRIDGGNGPLDADFSRLTLTGLQINSANGRLSAALPAGDYDGRIDGGNGAVQVRLPSGGRHELTVDGGNGSLAFLLPGGMPARLEFDRGNGSVSVDQRFDLIEGDWDKGIYETADYISEGDGILIKLETGNGSFRISQP